jgi:hypothetical protein
MALILQHSSSYGSSGTIGCKKERYDTAYCMSYDVEA